jgi:hypothetical protein
VAAQLKEETLESSSTGRALLQLPSVAFHKAAVLPLVKTDYLKLHIKSLAI